MYEDPHRWAHTFQAYVQMTMLEQHLHSCNAPVKLLERSLYSGRSVYRVFKFKFCILDMGTQNTYLC